MRDENRTVYSSEWGRMCPQCGHAIDACQCKKKKLPSGDGIVRLERQSKGRKGKPVTLIRGVLLDEDALQQLARDLKKICGSGGTLKEGTIEIQGDHRERLAAELQRRGFKIKMVGG